MEVPASDMGTLNLKVEQLQSAFDTFREEVSCKLNMIEKFFLSKNESTRKQLEEFMNDWSMLTSAECGGHVPKPQAQTKPTSQGTSNNVHQTCVETGSRGSQSQSKQRFPSSVGSEVSQNLEGEMEMIGNGVIEKIEISEGEDKPTIFVGVNGRFGDGDEENSFDQEDTFNEESMDEYHDGNSNDGNSNDGNSNEFEDSENSDGSNSNNGEQNSQPHQNQNLPSSSELPRSGQVQLPDRQVDDALNMGKQKCTLCNIYLHPNSLNRHMRAIHLGIPRSPKSAPPTPRSRRRIHLLLPAPAIVPKLRADKYECDACPNVIFSTNALLVEHISSFHHKNPIGCESCGKVFVIPYNFRQHQSTTMHGTRFAPSEDGTRRVKCIYCPRSYHNRSDYLVHMRSHTGEKPFRCDICKKHFADLRNLKRHRTKLTKCFSYPRSSTPSNDSDSSNPIILNTHSLSTRGNRPLVGATHDDNEGNDSLVPHNQ